MPASLMIAEKIQLKSARPDRQAARYDACNNPHQQMK
jgi:hypothetical protein